MLLAALCLLLVSTPVRALSGLKAPPSLMPGQVVAVTWAADGRDTDDLTVVLWSTGPAPTFSGYLALANAVDPQAQSASFLVPDVLPAAGYMLGLSSMAAPYTVLTKSAPIAIGIGQNATAGATVTTATGTPPSKTTPAAGAASSSHHGPGLSISFRPDPSSGTVSVSKPVASASAGRITSTGSAARASLPGGIPVSFPTGSFSYAYPLTALSSAVSSKASVSGSASVSVVSQPSTNAAVPARKGLEVEVGLTLLVGVVFFGLVA
ncbi:hypothetical protein MIND_00630700 [Mycena indigotica]|uniref:Uncharacterized protein n=1 Tax=Mycena indigotica TaxID=2126181 RepID=A0A8H6SQ74_9AGAR|nr:uncharacterized protein MIND_00630700 [Mycena indigotica]KAF7303995.1 hypothetical protein MIND_00630700 [Mycena indigotica]